MRHARPGPLASHQRGVTLIELLMTVVIGLIAFFPLAMPFIGEQAFLGAGRRQTEAQRDAQVGMRAIARYAHGGNSVDIPSPSSNMLLRFNYPYPGAFGNPNCVRVFPILGGGDGRFFLNPGCLDGLGLVLIDGVRSRVIDFTVTEQVANKLIRVTLRVAHRLQTGPGGDPREQDELLETELLLRNGPA